MEAVHMWLIALNIGVLAAIGVLSGTIKSMIAELKSK